MRVDIAEIRLGNRATGEFIKLADLYLMPTGVVAISTNYELAVQYFQSQTSWVNAYLRSVLKSLNAHSGERLEHRLRAVMPDNGLATYYDKVSSISLESALVLTGLEAPKE